MVLIASVLLCANSLFAVPTEAYVTINNHTLNGGVGNYGYNNRMYYITSSAQAQSSQIDAAMNGWIHTTSRVGITTPISYVKTSTQSSSVMDIYAGSYSEYPYNNANAFTEFWKYSNSINPAAENWGWNKIKINTLNTKNYLSDELRGVIAHEMGHCFGLDENNTNSQSVMCQMAYGRAVTLPMSDDLNGINYLY